MAWRVRVATARSVTAVTVSRERRLATVAKSVLSPMLRDCCSRRRLAGSRRIRHCVCPWGPVWESFCEDNSEMMSSSSRVNGDPRARELLAVLVEPRHRRVEVGRQQAQLLRRGKLAPPRLWRAALLRRDDDAGTADAVEAPSRA